MAIAKKGRKTSQKAKGKKAAAQGAPLPDGYRTVGRAPSWDVDKHPVISGQRGDEKTVTLDEGTKKEREVRTFIVEDAEIGPVTVWESTGLRDLFDQTESGDDVRIEYLGLGKAKRGQNAPRLFSCGKK